MHLPANKIFQIGFRWGTLIVLIFLLIITILNIDLRRKDVKSRRRVFNDKVYEEFKSVEVFSSWIMISSVLLCLILLSRHMCKYTSLSLSSRQHWKLDTDMLNTHDTECWCWQSSPTPTLHLPHLPPPPPTPPECGVVWSSLYKSYQLQSTNYDNW